MPKEDTQFKTSNEKARLAGVKSGISRRPIDKEGAAVRSHKYAETLMDMIFERICAAAPCQHCKRGGPIDARVFAGQAKSLVSLIEMIQARGWGRPAQESKYGKEASIEDFKRLRSFVNEANSSDVPDDIPGPPDAQ